MGEKASAVVEYASPALIVLLSPRAELYTLPNVVRVDDYTSKTTWYAGENKKIP